MKKFAFFQLCLSLSMYVFGAAPESLSIQGNALAEYGNDESVNLKKVDNYFELYTSLQNGEYTFSDATPGGTINEEGVYRIRVDYSEEKTTVSLQKIDKVYMWAPYSGKTLVEIPYASHSIFKAENVICPDGDNWFGKTSWGERRYRIRIKFSDGTLETYAPKDGKNFISVGNEDWGASDHNYDLSDKYRNDGQPFNLTISLTTDNEYKCSIEDYILELEPAPAPESLSIQGSALTEYTEAVAMKRFDSYFEIYTSLTKGDYTFSDETAGGSVKEDGIYRIKVQYTTQGTIVSLEKIDKVYMWAILNDKNIAELEYTGNAIFKANNVITNPEDWSAGWNETRYRIRVEFESGKRESYGKKDGKNFVLLEDFGQWDNPYDIANKYKEGMPFNLTVNFSVTDEYSFVIEDYIAPFPESLSMQGSALAEYGEDEAVAMRKFDTYYELYTVLQEGAYAFSDETAGGSVSDPGVYRIRVDYTDSPTAVELQKITKVYMWAPKAQKIVTELPYAGHSVFKKEDIRWDSSDWADDDRYRIRIDFGKTEDAFTETYGPKEEDTFSLIGNAQWEPSNYNYIPTGYVDNGKSFNSIVSLTTEAYTHAIEECLNPSSFVDYHSNNEFSVYPTAVTDRLTIECRGNECTVVIVSAWGQPQKEVRCHAGSTTLSCSDLSQGVYIVKAMQNGKCMHTERIVKL